MPDSNTGHLTLGTELEIDLRALQNAYDMAPVPIQWLWIDRPDRHAGVFAQQEWAFGQRWQVNIGARVDVSPRIAVTYKPANGTDLKLMYGRGFRNPSSDDMYWADGFTQIGNFLSGQRRAIRTNSKSTRHSADGCEPARQRTAIR